MAENKKRTLGIVVAAIFLFAGAVFPHDFILPKMGATALCVLFAALSLWVTESLPMSISSPWAEPEKELLKIRNLQLSKEEIAMILGENAKQLLYEAGAQKRIKPAQTAP